MTRPDLFRAANVRNVYIFVFLGFCAAPGLPHPGSISDNNSFAGTEIKLFDEDGIRAVDYRDTDHYRIVKQFINDPERMLSYLFQQLQWQRSLGVQHFFIRLLKSVRCCKQKTQPRSACAERG